MKRIPYDQMITGLDALFFSKPLQSIAEAIERVEIIEAYLDSCGYTWDDILDHMLAEELPYDQAQSLSTRIGHSGLS
jgi:hypothetical protein